MSAIGGENVTTTVEGRARFPVNVRYPRDLRDDLEALGRVLVMTPVRRPGPLAQLADIRTVTGPSMIRNENGLLVGYVYVDITGRDVGGYVEEAKRAVAAGRAAHRLRAGVERPVREHAARAGAAEAGRPAHLFLILFLLYANTRSLVKTLIVVLAVPFSVVGAVWLLWALDYNVSIAVWVGMIALMGLDAETGVFMLLFLDLAYDEAKKGNRLRSMAGAHEAIVHGAVKRLRPKMMTVVSAMVGLMPIMWSMGTGPT
jgi:copper/silver efflux system protein